jgi:hypothetical protein
MKRGGKWGKKIEYKRENDIMKKDKRNEKKIKGDGEG